MKRAADLNGINRFKYADAVLGGIPNGLSPMFQKFKVQHPPPGSSSVIRVVNLDNLDYEFGKFQYELPEDDLKYSLMKSDIDQFYKRLADRCVGNIHFSVVRSELPVVMKSQDGFKRAKIVSNLIQDNLDSYALVVLLDEISYPMTVSLKRLFYLHNAFTELPPKRRFFTLEGLEFYREVSAFRKIVMSMREDIFTGILVAEFLEPEVKICDSAVVRISGGPKYPEDKFPLGLNGFLIENIIRKMDQPQLPEEQLLRNDALVSEGMDNGNAVITFHTLFFEHLESRLAKLNDSVDSVKKLKEHNRNRFRSLYFSATEIYLVPYNEDGRYYRARFLARERTRYKVKVLFIDYGTTQVVRDVDLIIAREIDYLLTLFPAPVKIQVHLAGVEFMDQKRLPEIIDSNEVCTVKTLRAVNSRKLPEVEVRKQPNDPNFRSINEEIVAKIGNKSECSKELEKLTTSIRLEPTNFQRTTQHTICMDLIVWSAVEESPEIIFPGKTYRTLIATTECPDNVVLISNKRLETLDQFEKELLEFRKLPWKMVHQNTYFEIKLNDFFGYWWAEKNTFARVRIMESYQNLEMMQKVSSSCIQFLNVFLIDYGIKKRVVLQDLSLLKEEHCRYTPFALSSTITDPELFSPDDPGALINQEMINGTVCNVRIDEISYDAYGIPHAKIKIVDILF